VKTKKILLDIDSLLIAPVQRLPRYQLLIRDIASCLQADTVNHKETVALLKAIMRVNEEINNDLKKRENELIVADLQKRLCGLQKMEGPDFSLKARVPPRVFVREGSASTRKKLLVVEGIHVSVTRQLILLDDLLIEAKKDKDVLIVRRVYRIAENVEPITQATKDEDTVCLKPTKGPDHIIKFPADDKAGWITDLKKCLDGGYTLNK